MRSSTRTANMPQLLLARGRICLHFTPRYAIAGGDRIKCCDYALFGSEELSSNILAALEDRKACLIANHGLIALRAVPR